VGFDPVAAPIGSLDPSADKRFRSRLAQLSATGPERVLADAGIRLGVALASVIRSARK
jgi:hypothetical protein